MKDEAPTIAERIGLRPVVMPDDEPFLIELFYTSREDILQVPIAEEQKRTISLMQYAAQKQNHEAQFAHAANDIITLDGEDIGRLWVARYPQEIVCIEIILLPEFRNRKIGTKLMQDLFAEAAATGREFNFHVLKYNEKAQRFYKRLNCEFTGETEGHFKMRWNPSNELRQE